MRLKHRFESEPVIPTASMADIAFLLIIFFMVTISFEVDKAQVVLPSTVVRLEIPKKAAFISITDSGQIRVSNGEETSVIVPSIDDVLSFAATVVAINPRKEFVLKADTGVPYRTVDRVIDQLKQAKVEVVYLLSMADTVEGES